MRESEREADRIREKQGGVRWRERGLAERERVRWMLNKRLEAN